MNTIESYFDFARNKAFLDVSAHQGNDFQINAAFWKRLNDVTAAANAPGRFTVLPGYEWSGNTAIGGDHNVFYAEEGQTIHRCSHALLEDRTDIGTDAPTLTDLYAALRDKDATVYAHVGGRYANLAYDHDPKLETAVEVHSAWGTFEWILTDAFALGRRVGVVANSDGHKGRPGASYPGASTFGAYGGLTCFLTDRNDRAAIMEAQRRRHHYATTGCRMHIDLEAHLPKGALVCTRDPVVAPDAQRIAQPAAMMGDIVEGASGTVDIALAIEAHAGIERVDLRNGARTLETLRPYETSELGHRIRVIWSGAEYRGRGRNTTWRGQARLHGGRLLHIAPINLWNPERTLEQRGSDAVVFDTVTTGNFMGFDAWIEAGTDATLRVETNHGTLDVALATLSHEPVRMDAGGLARQIAVSRLPDTALPRRLSARRTVALSDGTDDCLWIAVTTEDGYQAWTSPIYLI